MAKNSLVKVCNAAPEDVYGSPLCLKRLSKDLRGKFRRRSLKRTCTQRDCQTVSASLLLTLGVQEHSQCDDKKVELIAGLNTPVPGPKPPDDWLDLASTICVELIAVVQGSKGQGEERERQAGFTLGTFTWNGIDESGRPIVFKGSMNGVVNVGTVRGGGAPSDKCCQDCCAPNFLEGRLCGQVVTRKSPFAGWQLVAGYRINFDAAPNFGFVNQETGERASRVAGVIEGVVLEPCASRRSAARR